MSQELGVFVHNNPEAKKLSVLLSLSVLSCHSKQHARNSLGLLPQGYCENEKKT